VIDAFEWQPEGRHPTVLVMPARSSLGYPPSSFCIPTILRTISNQSGLDFFIPALTPFRYTVPSLTDNLGES